MFGVARHVVHHGHQQKHATLYSGNKKQDLVNLPCKPAYPISILRAAKAHFTPALIPTPTHPPTHTPWKPTPELVRGLLPCILALAAATAPAPPRERRFSNALAGFWKEARARPSTGCSLVPFNTRMAL
jgi:hypothetical protein